MVPQLILKGFLTGMLLSMPIGPAAIMVIRRTINKNFRSGYYTAAGAATCDTMYALLAGFGVTYITSFLQHHQTEIQIVGSITLFILGLYIFRTNPLKKLKDKKLRSESQLQHYLTGFMVAMSNPLIVLAYIAVFAGTGIVFRIDELGDMLFYIGGFTSGALTWWFILSITINAFRHKFNLYVLYWFNKITGSIIILFVIVLAVYAMIFGLPKI